MTTLHCIRSGACEEGLKLLHAFHLVVLTCIPDEEVEDYEEWVAMLSGRAADLPRFEAAVLCCDATVVGGVAFETYASGAVLLTYLAVHSAHRGRGHARTLVAHCTTTADSTTGIVLEAHLPSVHDGFMDPIARLRVYEKLGFCALSPALQYTAPSVAPGTANVEGLMLLVKGGGGDGVRAGTDTAWLATFLAEYWRACYASDEGPLRRMLAWVAANPHAELVSPVP